MIKIITAVPVERDAYGFWTHPDYFVPANGNEFGVDGEFYAWKMRNRVTGAMIWMENEENAEDLQAAFDSVVCDVSLWQPKPPAGDGWFLASIHDTEDGPVCYWLRSIEFDLEALAAHRERSHLEALKIVLITKHQAAVTAAHEYFAACDLGEERLFAAAIFERLRVATRKHQGDL